MKGRILLTDHRWFEYLSTHGPFDEVNFWRPSGKGTPQIPPGTPVLLKLHQDQGGQIVGYGFFARHDNAVPAWLAWDAFQHANGAADLDAMRSQIEDYKAKAGARGATRAIDFLIGCTVLSQPVFFDRPLWIRPPADWPPTGIQVGKDYDLERGEGGRVWQELLGAGSITRGGASLSGPLTPAARYGKPSVILPRLGQGAFRLAVTAAYERACAVTGEHSLPALEAAHIRPFSNEGTHEVSNGLLLRSDIHRLFDMGYVGVTRDHRFVVSKALKDDFENGRSYYPLHGKNIGLPQGEGNKPGGTYLEWHLEARFRG